jgi:hypothetical protein
MDKHIHVTKDDGGGFSLIDATIIIILVGLSLLYFTSAVSRNSADQQTAQISAQESSPTQGVIKPPDIGDTGIHTTVPHPNADSEMEVIPPLRSAGDFLDPPWRREAALGHRGDPRARASGKLLTAPASGGALS